MDERPAAGSVRQSAARRGRLLVIAVTIFVLLGGAVAYKRSTSRVMHDYESGPVRTESDTTTGIVAEVGEVVTFGGIVLENFSNKPAVLESVRIDPPLPGGMSLVEVKVAGKDRRIGMVGADHGFPPSDIPDAAFRALAGAGVPPRQEDGELGVEVFMAFRIDRPGQFGFNRALIDYRIGAKRHRVRVEDGFVVCGPARDYPRGCDLESFAKRGG